VNEESEKMMARLQRLEDLEEIRSLYRAYGRHLDAGDFSAFATLFASDARLRLSPLAHADGRVEIEKAMTEALSSQKPGEMIHVLSSPEIELDGDMARGECAWMAVFAGPDGGPLLTSVGHHSDILVREDGRWLIQRRKGIVDMPMGRTRTT
jgi:uncharacterized protein (TIGR02246 family)